MDHQARKTIESIVSTEISDNQECDEDLAPCSPSPTRRRNRRFQIKSAIPLLPELESKIGIPAKPPPGTKGTPIQLYANHFPVTLANNTTLYQYEALVEKASPRQAHNWEEAMSRDQRRRFVQELAEKGVFDFIYWSVKIYAPLSFNLYPILPSIFFV